MKPQDHHRRSIRLPGWDYASAAAYYLTLVTADRACCLGDVVDEVFVPSPWGVIVEQEWRRSEIIRREIKLDEFIVMPNHLHALVWILETNDADKAIRRSLHGPAPRSLGSLMAGFKSSVTRRINELCGTSGMAVWQRNYFEHIPRDEVALNAIRKYIIENPIQWASDPENPGHPLQTQ